MFSIKRKESKLLFIAVLVLIIFIIGWRIYGGSYFPKFFSGVPEKVIVTKVIDGDTIVAKGGYHIRLLGIDADEKGYPCYEEAKKELENLILGKEVKLERDKEDKDQYGRYLRYVFLDDINVNLEMVRKGLAVARFYEPNLKYQKEIQDAEREAIGKKIGCKWKTVKESLRVVSACEAKNYIGKEVIVEGKIAEVYQSGKENVFLNFEKPYPNQCFTVVIFSSDVSYFPEDIKGIYTGKIVRVKGIVKEYKGKPEIILKSPLNIRLEDEKEKKLNNESWDYVFKFS